MMKDSIYNDDIPFIEMDRRLKLRNEMKLKSITIQLHQSSNSFLGDMYEGPILKEENWFRRLINKIKSK